MKKLALFAAVAGAAAIFPTAAFAAFNGVVVGKSPGSLAIASKSGNAFTITKTAGVISRTCTTAGQGGCKSGGSW